MHVLVTVKLQDDYRANAIKLCDAKRFDVGTFQDAAKILDKIISFLNKIEGAKEVE